MKKQMKNFEHPIGPFNGFVIAHDAMFQMSQNRLTIADGWDIGLHRVNYKTENRRWFWHSVQREMVSHVDSWVKFNELDNGQVIDRTG
jgi:hypothetical protein